MKRTNLISHAFRLLFCMIMLYLFLLLFLPVLSYAEPHYSNEAITNAIYKAEGGLKAHTPYGIETVPCQGEKECRQICINTIRNNKKRYLAYGYKKYKTYLEFLASRYCPYNSKIWLKNVKYFLAKYKRLTKGE